MYRNPQLTICIPVYNSEEFLAQAIISVINQSFKNWRLLILNDGSTDNSMVIAKNFSKDKRIQIIDDGKNMGLVYRLNQSISITNTPYYVRMDSDDIMHFKRLETQLDIFNKNPNIDVLGSNVYSIDRFNSVRGVRSLIDDRIRPVTSFVHPSIMGKTSWFVTNTYMEIATRMEDSELWYRSKSYSNFYETLTPLLFYREFGGIYYKKYFKAFPSEVKLSWYYLKQRKYRFAFRWLKQSPKRLVKGLIYRVFALLNKEQLLINKRSILMSTSETLKAEEDLSKSLKDEWL